MNHKIIYKGIVGSQAYGTNIPTSDIDYKGVYVQPNNDVLGFKYKEQYEAGKDECYYEIRRFIQLLGTANPTVLEMLFLPTDCLIINDRSFDVLIENRNMFLTKKCLQSFGGYAIAQIKKARGLDKKMNWEKNRIERKGIMDFCYIITLMGTRPLKEWLRYQKGSQSRQETYGVCAIANAKDTYFIYESAGDLGYHGIVNLDESSNDLRLSSIPKDQLGKSHTLVYNKENYMRHCKDYREYCEWLEKRNTQRYVDVNNHDQKIDGKNLMHCRRLLDSAIEIATIGTLNVRRENREYLLSIRRGEVSLDKIIEEAEQDVKGLDLIYENSSLPEDVDFEKMNDLLLEIRENAKD